MTLATLSIGCMPELSAPPSISDAGAVDAWPADGAQPVAVAEDACSSDLLRDARHCGRCGHDCTPGSCAGGICQPYVLAEGELSLSSLWLMRDVLYLANDGTARGDVGSILSLRLAAGERPSRVAADVVATHVMGDATRLWWASRGQPRWSMRRALGSLESATHAGRERRPLVFGLDAPRELALRGETLFWLDEGLPFAGEAAEGKLLSCTLPSCSDLRVLASGLRGPAQLTLAGEHVCWLERAERPRSAAGRAWCLEPNGAAFLIDQGVTALLANEGGLLLAYRSLALSRFAFDLRRLQPLRAAEDGVHQPIALRLHGELLTFLDEGTVAEHGARTGSGVGTVSLAAPPAAAVKVLADDLLEPGARASLHAFTADEQRVYFALEVLGRGTRLMAVVK